MNGMKRFWRFVVFALLGAAVYSEYSKDPEERTGQGVVAGVVPYDFRPPTVDKVRSALWNPEDDRLFVPTIFGVGWTLNFARLLQMVGAGR
jgi:hypothetical protein